MGFLHESEPLSWDQALDSLRLVREHGIEQFLAVFRRCRDIEGDAFKWGDEVEHGIFSLAGDSDDASRSVRVALRSPDVLAELRAMEARGEELARHGSSSAHEPCSWMPEYGRWMLESTPGRPFLGVEGTAQLESNLKLRRARLAAALRPGEIAPTVTSMPLFGVKGFCEPHHEPEGPTAESLFVPDEVIFPHPRFPTLTKNIRLRRGSRVEIRRPRFQAAEALSKHGKSAPIPTSQAEADALDHVYADAMAFGMGNCCLQVTMQASSLTESRYLYDQLAPLTPIMLALTAATPFMRGWICDDDTRWGQLAQSVDDRTPAERGSAPSNVVGHGDERLAGRGARPLRKSRYDSIDCYIGEGPEVSKYNDMPLILDEAHVARLVEGGVDQGLAKHIAHLFARDPLVLFGDRIHLDDERDIDHWENLQSTNWQTLRWKPPPPDKGALPSSAEGHIGWRVEFRSMEVQITDFENAAFSSFIVLLSRTILASNLNLYIPMSKLEENMQNAQRREACTAERFWFRINISDDEGVATSGAEPFALMTIGEIFLGTGSFQGLIPLCRRHLETADYELATRELLEEYLAFIARRAEGKTMTTATWMRNFVLSHEAYQQDARVPPAAAYDLMIAAAEIGEGKRACPELVGEVAKINSGLPAAMASTAALADMAPAQSSSSRDLTASRLCLPGPQARTSSCCAASAGTGNTEALRADCHCLLTTA